MRHRLADHVADFRRAGCRRDDEAPTRNLDVDDNSPETQYVDDSGGYAIEGDVEPLSDAEPAHDLEDSHERIPS